MSDADRRTRRFFVQGGGFSRRPVDLAIGVLGVLVVAVSTREVATGAGDLDAAVRHLADDLPRWLVGVFEAAYFLGFVYAAAAAVLTLLTFTRRGRLPLTLLLAAAVAIAGVLVASFLAGEGWPDLDPAPAYGASESTFPVVRIAVSAAVLLVLRPWLVLAYRRLSMTIVVIQCLAAWMIGIGGPTDVAGALGVGLAAAGIALVVFGSPAGYPDLAQVARALDELGVEADHLEFAEHQPWGVRELTAVSPTLGPLVVKIYGRDASDAHRAARWGRSLAYRDQSAPDATRLQLVEHEALVTLLAGKAGVAVPEVVAAGADQGDAVLALTAPPPPLAERDDLDDATLDAVWAAVRRLHRAGLAHTRLTLERVGQAADGAVVISDFAEGRVAASVADKGREVATQLTAQALLVGPERAAGAAIAGLGADAVAASLPYLQRAALPRSLRATDGVKAALPALVAVITERTGVEPPAPAPIVRVKLRDLLQTGLILFAAYALLSTLVGIDWNTVVNTWQNAAWGWVAAGLVVAQATSVADSVSTMSAVPSRLPLWPLVQIQYAVKTVGLAISATVGRVALTTSFLRRFGEPPTVAVSAAALDAFAASVCNAIVVVLGLIFVNRVPSVSLSGPDDLDQLALLLVVVLVVSVLVLVLVRPLRAKVVEAGRAQWASLRIVTASPTRALLMFGSNLVSLLITGLCLTLMVQGLYPGPGFADCVFVVAAAALFSALIPVPGNVGVAEAALTAGLVAVGVPSGPAFAIAVTQRIATSYGPDVYGAWALRWLRRADWVS
ncbi:lysylphosphatidylglycerol synthase domain-containing protein [Nocardioides sp.]|uniref:lysylphosphatidylglycerol synthase domain-containing protein n=1 Tax=Nocardioides sp. TaxID=35761 RepID=UPI0037845FBB